MLQWKVADLGRFLTWRVGYGAQGRRASDCLRIGGGRGGRTLATAARLIGLLLLGKRRLRRRRRRLRSLSHRCGHLFRLLRQL